MQQAGSQLVVTCMQASDNVTLGRDIQQYGLKIYAGMQTYISAMDKYEPAYTYNGVAFQGWQSAALIVAGIRAAGSALTQANVVRATNKITDFTAGGLSAPVNWSTGHVGYTEPNCSTVVQVRGSQYVIVFRKGVQVFTCLGPSVRNPVPVTPPKGTPGI